ncbi:conserved hypothetical protein [Rheinheimera pacifica]|uniref:Glycosyltransferase n=1 Tax=Rheinheimera pacifica TaxID=173990 RepID=A0A1H6KJM0_9GAMM|nr:MJ1255/VC2487 family glycosyltransferase [Rheinheimera pacifica]SEH75482.1 conserved hypothetical protein [Rheinheimera pacifica]
MKILYGVQATGNGHISRARAMGKYLAKAGIQVDYLFSGRPAEQLFDMQQFGDYQVKRGLTFVTEAGKVNYWQTLRQASVQTLWQDVKALDCSSYDLVLTDFEPITAHAAKQQKKRSVALGHQYAFLHKIPMEHANLVTHLMFRHFAPAQIRLGLHWHHFNQPILPPIIDEEPDEEHDAEHASKEANRVLVYLPFEDQQQVIGLLKPLTEFQFSLYGPGLAKATIGHIDTHPPALHAFKADLARCSHVLSNAGFELISEALQLQKHIMVKPLQGQMEQQSNALALQQLKLACRTDSLSTGAIAKWLNEKQQYGTVNYPNVASAICNWLLQDTPGEVNALSKTLWS